MGYIMNISAIIMAAGLSKRMNQDKLTMKIKGKYIYEYIFETINNCIDCFQEVIVVAKDDNILAKAIEVGFKTVKNELSHLGQSESIKLGIKNSGTVNGYMFFTADQPFISKETIVKLTKEFQEKQNNIIIPCYDGINGSPVIFPEVFKEQLLKLSGDTGGKIIIKQNWNNTIKIPINSVYENIDIDTMEDYLRVCNEEGD